MDQLVDELWHSQIAEPERPELLQPETATQPVADQLARGLGEKHLPAVRSSFHPGTTVDRRVVDTAAAVRPRFPGMQPHPHLQREARRPRLMRQPELAGARRLDRGNRAGKHREETVTLPARADHHSAIGLDNLSEKAIVPLQSRSITSGTVSHSRVDPSMSVSKNVTVPAGSSTGPGSPGPVGDMRGAPVPAIAPAKLSLKRTARSPASSPSSSLGVAKVRYDTVAGRADAVEHRRQPRLPVPGRTLDVQQHGLAGSEPVLDPSRIEMSVAGATQPQRCQ